MFSRAGAVRAGERSGRGACGGCASESAEPQVWVGTAVPLECSASEREQQGLCQPWGVIHWDGAAVREALELQEDRVVQGP